MQNNYSRNNLPNLKDTAYMINLNDYRSIGTHWVAQYVNAKTLTYFDSFEVEHIPREIKKFIANKYIICGKCRNKVKNLGRKIQMKQEII